MIRPRFARWFPISSWWPRAALAIGAAVALASGPLGMAESSAMTASTASGPAFAQNGESGSATQTVHYRGYQVDVPANWKVVDLEEHPQRCVRFDVSAVYLGHPSDQSSCPPGLTGRQAGLLIEPLDATAVAPLVDSPTRAAADTAAPPERMRPGSPAWDHGAVELAVEAAGVLVTGVHQESDAHLVATALDSAELTAAAEPATVAAAERAATRDASADPGTDPGTDPGAEQEVPVQPGDYTGLGFDACAAPSAAAMDAWWADSPYEVVGVYTSGPQRACAQPNLTPQWVRDRVDSGWRLTPIHVGRQAPQGCTSRDYENQMSADPATANEQGVEAADEAVAAVQALGIPAGSALYLDIEGYTRGGDCTPAVLAHTSGWTDRLHEHGYLSGFYSSAASGISDMNDQWGSDQYSLPDHLWFAWWNDQADVDGGPYLDDDKWADGQRIHQYVGEVTESHGGHQIEIDRNYMEVLAGDPPDPGACASVNLDFAAYPDLDSGDSGEGVLAAQCLLASAGFDTGEGDPTGEVDEATSAAITEFQDSVGLDTTGAVGSPTWTALLAQGTTPTLQEGDSGAAVQRVQRALTAALGVTVDIDGQFGSATADAVTDYQSSVDLEVDAIVGAQTWAALQQGR